MTTRQGSTRTRESLRNAAVYHGVKVNEFQAGLKTTADFKRDFCCMVFWLVQDAGRKVLVFVCPFPQLSSLAWSCFSGGLQCHSLTGCLQIIWGPFLSCLPKCVSLFFFGVGVKFQKDTHTHTTQHLGNTFPRKMLLKSSYLVVNWCHQSPESQNFPSTRRQRVPALRRMRPLQSLVNLWYNFWWFLPPKCFKDYGDFQPRGI